jgi:dTDP-4-dehydrorhamnose 3,5-epimerase-like enzyme
MTAVKGFGGKWIAVNPLDTIVFCMTQHQTVIQSKMTLTTGWFLEFQSLEESSNLKYNMYNHYKPYNTKCIKYLDHFKWNSLI